MKEVLMSKRMWRYECMQTTCGYVELATYAPAATKRCPKCAGMMKRVEHGEV
jgi:predicted nucleic acid-binding Zn ribbon protein